MESVLCKSVCKEVKMDDLLNGFCMIFNQKPQFFWFFLIHSLLFYFHCCYFFRHSAIKSVHNWVLQFFTQYSLCWYCWYVLFDWNWSINILYDHDFIDWECENAFSLFVCLIVLLYIFFAVVCHSIQW